MVEQRPGPYRIATNTHQTDLCVDAPALEVAVRLVLDREHVAEAEISLAVVDSATMQSVNQRFLQHDYDTDVLSFLLESEQIGGRGKRIEGEVLLSAAIAEREAAKFGWSPQNELTLYAVHGALHLCGYDDQTPEDLSVMRSREREILAELGLTPKYSDQEGA